MGHIDEDFESAVESLYESFARYKMAPVVHGCPHCTGEADQLRIRARPLRELDGGDLQRYAFKALSTWGDADDLRHFLPRLLELVARFGSVGATDGEIVLGKLVYGDWEKWPSKEREAIRDFLWAWWRWLLRALPAVGGPSSEPDALAIIAEVEDDLSPYLSAWLADGISPAAWRLFADFVNLHGKHWLDLSVKPWNAFLDGRQLQVAQVGTWLADGATLAAAERAFFRFADEPWAGELSDAVLVLETIGRTANWLAPPPACYAVP